MDLNIIGNGFDLYHGLPSSYYYFGCYLIKTDPEFYEEIGKMYELRHLQMIGSPIAHDYDYVVENMFWSDFESHLSKVDELFVVDTSEDDLGLENPDPVDIEINHDMSADILKEKFSNWIKDTIDFESNFSVIRERILPQNAMQFNDGDYFLQFNYTHTLQELYGIDSSMIHYVHGENHNDDGSELIVGHGNDDRIIDIEETIRRLEEDYDYTQSSSNRINEYNSLLRYIRKLRKNVHLCMAECESFYDELEDIKNINLYGLSLGEVDLPYLAQLRAMWPNAKWSFSYYSDSSISHIDAIAKSYLKLGDEDFSKFKFANSTSSEMRNEILELEDIEEVSSA